MSCVRDQIVLMVDRMLFATDFSPAATKLIVLEAKTRSRLLTRFSGGVVGEVLSKAECPVLS